jgi:hypothetical protein
MVTSSRTCASCAKIQNAATHIPTCIHLCTCQHHASVKWDDLSWVLTAKDGRWKHKGPTQSIPTPSPSTPSLASREHWQAEGYGKKKKAAEHGSWEHALYLWLFP